LKFFASLERQAAPMSAWSPKADFLTEFWNKNAQQGRILCVIFTKFSGFVGSSSVG